MSWPSAMKVLAAVCAAPVLGDATTVVGVLEADEAAELADELHAVTSNAAHPSAAHAATCLARCEFVVHMDFPPL